MQHRSMLTATNASALRVLRTLFGSRRGGSTSPHRFPASTWPTPPYAPHIPQLQTAPGDHHAPDRPTRSCRRRPPTIPYTRAPPGQSRRPVPPHAGHEPAAPRAGGCPTAESSHPTSPPHPALSSALAPAASWRVDGFVFGRDSVLQTRDRGGDGSEVCGNGLLESTAYTPRPDS